MTNLYNDTQQKKIAWQLAQAELATEQQSMSATETKRGLGMVSDLEYLQAQSSFLGSRLQRKLQIWLCSRLWRPTTGQ